MRQIEYLTSEVSVTFSQEIKDKESLEKALMKVKSAKKMIEDGVLESGIPEKISEFQEALSIKP
jgi:xylose isomerase